LNRTGRDVDAYDVEATALQVDADAPCAATEIEDAAADVAHRAPLLRTPLTKRRQVVRRIAGEDAPVVPLDDLDHGPASREILQQMSERVLIGTKDVPQHPPKLDQLRPRGPLREFLFTFGSGDTAEQWPRRSGCAAAIRDSTGMHLSRSPVSSNSSRAAVTAARSSA